MNRHLLMLVAAAALGLGIVGCKDDPEPAKGPTPAPQPAPAGAPTKPADAHPNAVVLGTQTVSGLQLKAMQDEPIKPGGEGAFDLLITGGAKPKAVRFWVGVESGEGSAKAKAEEETPNNWHTHAEVPNPIPAGSKFWAEVEPAVGETFKVSFEFKK